MTADSLPATTSPEAIPDKIFNNRGSTGSPNVTNEYLHRLGNQGHAVDIGCGEVGVAAAVPRCQAFSPRGGGDTGLILTRLARVKDEYRAASLCS